ncbi:hypothetical protein PMAYCL1PPCAC_23728, partial [Pristionchus mayeri]
SSSSSHPSSRRLRQSDGKDHFFSLNQPYYTRPEDFSIPSYSPPKPNESKGRSFVPPSILHQGSLGFFPPTSLISPPSSKPRFQYPQSFPYPYETPSTLPVPPPISTFPSNSRKGEYAIHPTSSSPIPVKPSTSSPSDLFPMSGGPTGPPRYETAIPSDLPHPTPSTSSTLSPYFTGNRPSSSPPFRTPKVGKPAYSSPNSNKPYPSSPTSSNNPYPSPPTDSKKPYPSSPTSSNNPYPSSPTSSTSSNNPYPSPPTDSKKPYPSSPTDSNKPYPYSPTSSNNLYPSSPTDSNNPYPSSPTSPNNPYPSPPTNSKNSYPSSPTSSKNPYPSSPTSSNNTYPSSPTASNNPYPSPPTASKNPYPSSPTSSNNTYPSSPTASNNPYPSSPTSSKNPYHSNKPYPSSPTSSNNPYPSPPTESKKPYPSSPTSSKNPYPSSPTASNNPYPSSPTSSKNPYPSSPTDSNNPYPSSLSPVVSPTVPSSTTSGPFPPPSGGIYSVDCIDCIVKPSNISIYSPPQGPTFIIHNERGGPSPPSSNPYSFFSTVIPRVDSTASYDEPPPPPGSNNETKVINNRIKGMAHILCMEKGVEVNAIVVRPFEGTVSTLVDGKKKCIESFEGQSTNVSIFFSYEECGFRMKTIDETKGEWETVVLFSFPSSQESFLVQCLSQSVKFDSASIPKRFEESLEEFQLIPTKIEQKAPLPSVLWSLTEENRPEVEIGTLQVMLFNLTPPTDAYGFHVRNCVVIDEKSGDRHSVIDRKGCSSDMAAFTHPQYNTLDDTIRSEWMAFKLPDHDSLHISCSYFICPYFPSSSGDNSSFCSTLPTPPHCPRMLSTPSNSLSAYQTLSKREAEGGVTQRVEASLPLLPPSNHSQLTCFSPLSFILIPTLSSTSILVASTLHFMSRRFQH